MSLVHGDDDSDDDDDHDDNNNIDHQIAPFIVIMLKNSFRDQFVLFYQLHSIILLAFSLFISPNIIGTYMYTNNNNHHHLFEN